MILKLGRIIEMMLLSVYKSKNYSTIYMVNCTVFFNFGIYIVRVLLQGIAIEKSNVHLPYSKINEYGISAEGLPEDKELKHPSSYGKKCCSLFWITVHQSQSKVRHVLIWFTCARGGVPPWFYVPTDLEFWHSSRLPPPEQNSEIYMYTYTAYWACSTYVHVHVCVFVGSCLATKGQFAGYRKGVGHHKVERRSTTITNESITWPGILCTPINNYYVCVCDVCVCTLYIFVISNQSFIESLLTMGWV